MRSENDFNGIYFQNHFYLKTGDNRNGLSLGCSEWDTSSVPSVRRRSLLHCWLAEDTQYFGHIVHLPLHNAQYMDVVVYHCIGIKQKMHFRFNVMLRFALKDIKKWLVGNKSVFCLVISPSINWGKLSYNSNWILKIILHCKCLLSN